MKIFEPLAANDVYAPPIDSPVLTAVQVAPLLLEKKTPALFVPAKILLPLTNSELMNKDESPVFTGDQLVPLLVDKKTPPSVPAKMFVPLMATDCTNKLVRPVFFCVQVVPLFVDRNIPSCAVPANRLTPLIARLFTYIACPVVESVLLIADHVAPLLVER